MGAAYTRQSTYNTGDVIEADDTNAEFAQLLAVFNATTGHTHDGTAGEGAKIAAVSITFDNTTSGLTAEDIQAAIDEIEARLEIEEGITITGPVVSVNGNTGVVVLTATDLGLGNVDNTSDADKPVSTAQQTSLDLKADITGETLIDSTFAASSVRQIADASLGTGTHTFNYTNGDMQQLTSTGAITVAFSNLVSGAVSGFIVDAVDWGASVITLPVGTLYADGVPPTFTASGTDRLMFLNDKDDVLSLHVINQDIKA
jgi:hypothetical protein